MNLLIPHLGGGTVLHISFYKDVFGIKQPTKVEITLYKETQPNNL